MTTTPASERPSADAMTTATKDTEPSTCPKCGATSGDDWSQCLGSCPMPMSPHYVGAVDATTIREIGPTLEAIAYLDSLLGSEEGRFHVASALLTADELEAVLRVARMASIYAKDGVHRRTTWGLLAEKLS